MRDSAEPGNLLAELRSLRFFPGSEDDFWPRFLSGVASICKTSWVLRLTRGKSADVWSLAQDFGTNLDKEQIRQALEDNLLQVAERAQSTHLRDCEQPFQDFHSLPRLLFVWKKARIVMDPSLLDSLIEWQVPRLMTS